MQGREGQPVVLFDLSKRSAANPKAGSKELVRKLKAEFRVVLNEDTITAAVLQEVNVALFLGSREKFTADEFTVLKQFMEGGGAVMILLGEGGESKFPTNVNYFLEEYGVSINNDAVVRTAFYKYHHPKECCITSGVLAQDLCRSATPGGEKKQGGLQLESTKQAMSVEETPQLPFVYPYGATLSVQKPAQPVLSSGSISYPLNRPLCAAVECGQGRLVCSGRCASSTTSTSTVRRIGLSSTSSSAGRSSPRASTSASRLVSTRSSKITTTSQTRGRSRRT
jgi:intraflagellar transport protein 52